MYTILSKLYDKEIEISKYIYIETNKNIHLNREIFILNIITKLNNLLANLIIDCNSYIDKILDSNDILKTTKIAKFIKIEEYIQYYIFDLKMLFTEQINIYYEDTNFIGNTTNNTTNDTTNDNIIYKRIINIDKFYTNIPIVHECISNFNNLYDMNIFDLVIEPSAGSGNFLLNIKHNNKIGLDIEPEHESIIKKSFFEYYPDINLYSNILTIGNPPFGRVCSLAIKFFNHAAKFSNAIAFIIPRSFRKISIQNKLDINFKLISDMDISNKLNTFDPPINVKCCFQIWIRTNNKRLIKKQNVKHIDWKFLHYTKDDILLSDFAIRAYGGNCGEIIENNFDTLNNKGWHFIKSNINIDTLKLNFSQLDFKNSKNTARQNSLGKAELVDLYTKKYN